MDHAASVIRDHSVILCDILGEAAKSWHLLFCLFSFYLITYPHTQTDDEFIDLQDLYGRFTLDCFFEIAFHHKLNCMRTESSFHRFLYF